MNLINTLIRNSFNTLFPLIPLIILNFKLIIKMTDVYYILSD